MRKLKRMRCKRKEKEMIMRWHTVFNLEIFITNGSSFILMGNTVSVRNKRDLIIYEPKNCMLIIRRRQKKKKRKKRKDNNN